MTATSGAGGMQWIVRVVSIAAGVLILGASTWGIIDQSKATGSHAALVAALAFGTAIGAVVMARASFVVGVLVFLAVIAGEGYGMLATAERILSVREGQQSPARDAQARKLEAKQVVDALRAEVVPSSSARLQQALEVKKAADTSALSKSAERGCAENCRQLLEGAVARATTEVTDARKEIEAQQLALRQRLERAEEAYRKIVIPGSGSPLADRLGLAPWVFDLIAAGLLTIGANCLAAVLIAWGSHAKPRRKDARQEVRAESVAGVAPVAAPSKASPAPQLTEKAPPPAPVAVVAEVATPAPVAAAAEEGTALAVQAGDFVDFCFDSLVPTENGIVEQEAIEQSYQAWCRRRKLMALPAEKVREGIVAYCKASQGRVQRGQRGGVIYVVGVELRKSKRGLRVA